MVRGVEKTSDSVEAVREREPGFKAESIPPDDAAAVEALAATSIDRLEAHHRQEVIVAGVQLASQRFWANGEEVMIVLCGGWSGNPLGSVARQDIEAVSGGAIESGTDCDSKARRCGVAGVDPGIGSRDSLGTRENVMDRRE
jgi:hypothetical protein